MRLALSICICGGLVCQGGPAAATEPLYGVDLEQLLQMPVITATRTDQPLRTAAGTVLVLNRQDIRERGYRHLGELLRALRQVTDDYAVPGDACASYRALYQALPDFETDLHQHIHLENNILFPRAVELEAQAAPEIEQMGREYSCPGH